MTEYMSHSINIKLSDTKDGRKLKHFFLFLQFPLQKYCSL